MDDDRSHAGAPPAQRRLYIVTEDDLDEIAYLEACAEAEQCALALIEDAREEAAEQGKLAIHHAQLANEHTTRQLKLLRLADRTERAIKHSTRVFLPPPEHD